MAPVSLYTCSSLSSSSVTSMILCFLLMLQVSPILPLVSASSSLSGPLNCYHDNSSTGLLLPPQQYEHYGMCPPGYYCPHANISDPHTWPRICPASLDCLELRKKSVQCGPQGPYEPIPCKEGHYCPSAREMIPCGEGYWCPPAAIFPRECGPLSLCPALSTREMDLSGLVLLLVIDIIFGVGLLIRSRVRERRLTEANIRAAKYPKPESWDELSQAGRETFSDGIRKRRGKTTPVTFKFKNLRVSIPARATHDDDDDGKHPYKGTGSSVHVDALSPVAASARRPIKDEQEDSKETGSKKEVVLLNGMTGELKPGRVTAVMGPSGAGKTVFLSTLLGKIDQTWKCSGSMTINNHSDAIEEFKHVIGYVPQDDILHPEISVYDNVWYSSEIRLPSDWKVEEREEYRDVVLSTLGLQAVRNVKVGNEEERGVSGGQRKRASVALELASAPLAAFLDEPTTGLDATTALELCKALKDVATATQMTVAMVVHQPRVEIWRELDEVLFIGPGGRTVYQGPQSGAASYFTQAIGLDFSRGNPADIIIDGIAAFPDECIAKWADFHPHEDDEREEGSSPLAIPQSRAAFAEEQEEQSAVSEEHHLSASDHNDCGDSINHGTHHNPLSDGCMMRRRNRHREHVVDDSKKNH